MYELDLFLFNHIIIYYIIFSYKYLFNIYFFIINKIHSIIINKMKINLNKEKYFIVIIIILIYIINLVNNG